MNGLRNDWERYTMTRAPQPGLDDRYRDEDGSTHKKRGDTLVRTLRGIYGAGFAPDIRGDARLDTLLEREGCATLDQYLKRRR